MDIYLYRRVAARIENLACDDFGDARLHLRAVSCATRARCPTDVAHICPSVNKASPSIMSRSSHKYSLPDFAVVAPLCRGVRLRHGDRAPWLQKSDLCNQPRSVAENSSGADNAQNATTERGDYIEESADSHW